MREKTVTVGRNYLVPCGVFSLYSRVRRRGGGSRAKEEKTKTSVYNMEYVLMFFFYRSVFMVTV